jgi:hypothetical protein
LVYVIGYKETDGKIRSGIWKLDKEIQGRKNIYSNIYRRYLQKDLRSYFLYYQPIGRRDPRRPRR